MGRATSTGPYRKKKTQVTTRTPVSRRVPRSAPIPLAAPLARHRGAGDGVAGGGATAPALGGARTAPGAPPRGLPSRLTGGAPASPRTSRASTAAPNVAGRV